MLSGIMSSNEIPAYLHKYGIIDKYIKSTLKSMLSLDSGQGQAINYITHLPTVTIIKTNKNTWLVTIDIVSPKCKSIW